MSEPKQDVILPEITLPEQVSVGSPTVQTAASAENRVTVNVYMPKPAAPQRAKQGNPLRRSQDDTPTSHGTQSGTGNSVSPPRARGTRGNSSEPDVTHRVYQDRGDEQHVLTDRDGSTVVVRREAETGDYSVTFNDNKARFSTDSDEPGFKGERLLPYGYGGSKKVKMEVSAGSLFTSGSIYCSDDVSPLSWSGFDRDTASLTNRQVDTTTVHEIKSFMRRNPALASEVERMGVPITEIAGSSMTAKDLGHLAPALQACPTGRDDDYLRTTQPVR